MLKPVFSCFWLVVWASFLSLSWLLPNHYLPWVGFHTDLWVAVFVLVAAFAVLIRSRDLVVWHWLACMAGVSAFIPFVQYAFGLIYFVGQAWTTFLYLSGFSLVLVLGQHWENVSRNQMLDGLFLAIGIASIISVGMALYQWLDLEGLELWIMPDIYTGVYANFAQPNKLGTFLLWGIVACAWGYIRHYFRGAVAVMMAVFFVFGIALTWSRTAFVGLAIVTVAGCVWYRYLSAAKLARPAFILLPCLGFFLWLIPNLTDLLLLQGGRRFIDAVEVMQVDSRIIAYQLFLHALAQKPLFGFGWFHVAEAYFSAIEAVPALGVVFMHSHNLFLDLLLWNGVAVGGGISAALLVWGYLNYKAVSTAEDVLLLVFVGVVAWHAMLELPLHYASFLLPVGLVMGGMNARLSASWVFRARRTPVLGALIVMALLVSLLASDYMKVESNFLALRFERARIGGKAPEPIPDLYMLTHLKAFLKIARSEPKQGLTAEELEFLRQGALAVPIPSNFAHLIQALVINGCLDEAQSWMAKMRNSMKIDVYEKIDGNFRVWMLLSEPARKLLGQRSC